ncbi:xylanase [Planomonospora parontospora subsp. parontospora]|uniref:Xylanase n=2 Tax=Planomonospora parontospora TaxID=58119 RepID=A0AA37BPD9_9ACTN|nr:polysaccharide deacetylase family protein [Planomonospora parontospora]GGK99231.1 xylanase [Planomonospora parontospora]GII10928.1 xylanase [Planomonospora parontospora subsp. parontospora]
MSCRRVGAAGLAAALACAALTGCMPWEDEPEQKKIGAAAGRQGGKTDQSAVRKEKAARAAKVKANELGQIPVLMYHRVVDKPTAPDDRTPEQFRKELERLAVEGYVPITAAEYVRGRIGVPPGKHPVVLTFDDASPEQLTLDGTGTPMPNTAVAILQEVARKHPGFRPVATFYVTRDLFGKTTPEEQTQMLTWLRENGFDIGNHTYGHRNLLGKPKKEAMAEIAKGHELITKLTGTDPVTLALPYGNQPSTKSWALKGRAGNVSYDYGGVFRAGYTPGPSPFSKDFDPVNLPRIRSMDKIKKDDCARFCSTAWLDWLKANPSERYTSDGDVATVAYAKFKAPFMASGFTPYALPY